MPSFALERFAFHAVLAGYAALISAPYLSAVSPRLAPALFCAAAGYCAARGADVERLLSRLWDRLDSPEKKAILYFGAACAPMLWWPFYGFKLALSFSMLFFGSFLAPACLKALSPARIAGTTAGLSVFLLLCAFPRKPPAALGLLCLTAAGCLSVLLPYTVLVLGFLKTPGALLRLVYRRLSLLSAIEAGRFHMALRMLEAGQDPDKPIGDETPLHWAARLNRPEIMRLLLDRGARVDPRNGAAQTPLMLAAAQGHLDCARALLDAGADRSLADSRGETAAAHAQAAGHSDVANLLGARY